MLVFVEKFRNEKRGECDIACCGRRYQVEFRIWPATCFVFESPAVSDKSSRNVELSIENLLLNMKNKMAVDRNVGCMYVASFGRHN